MASSWASMPAELVQVRLGAAPAPHFMRTQALQARCRRVAGALLHRPTLRAVAVSFLPPPRENRDLTPPPTHTHATGPGRLPRRARVDRRAPGLPPLARADHGRRDRPGARPGALPAPLVHGRGQRAAHLPAAQQRDAAGGDARRRGGVCGADGGAGFHGRPGGWVEYARGWLVGWLFLVWAAVAWWRVAGGLRAGAPTACGRRALQTDALDRYQSAALVAAQVKTHPVGPPLHPTHNPTTHNPPHHQPPP
jgi:hypothetical protein